jgi:release factor glutamine methyltransferase
VPVQLSARELAGVAATLRGAGCVFAEDEAELLAGAADTPEQLQAMVRERSAGLPIEQVVGWAEFCGLRILVDPGVFVPRRRSEFLVCTAADQRAASAAAGQPPVILDMCCGTGAVGLALAAKTGAAQLYAADVDPAAAACARRNLAGAGTVHEGDLYEPLPASLRGRVDILVANAPYVPTAEIALMPHEARAHEPRVALDGGPDGVSVHRRVAAGAPGWLSPGGLLLIETSARQAALTEAAVADAGLSARTIGDEDWSATVVVGSPAG